MMHASSLCLGFAAIGTMALPTREDNSNVSLSDPNYGPIPGESRTYVDYNFQCIHGLGRSYLQQRLSLRKQRE